MADYNKYDPRVDSLVVETRTRWDADVGGLQQADKSARGRDYRKPHLAGKDCLRTDAHRIHP